MRKRFLLSLLVALLTTLSTHAYDFKSGDLYYNITSDTTVEVTYQEEWSESNYQGLTTATIPESVTYNGTTYSVTSIGWEAFSHCSSLTSITLPNSVTSIGEYAFEGCTSLPIVDNLRYADTYLVEAVDKSLSTYTIKAGTKWIGDDAFFDCSALTSITLPNSVTSIGDGAFSDCSSLTSITLPNSVTSIGAYAFYNCSALTSITLPNSVTSIGDYAFKGCSSLTSITLPNSVTSIGSNAFYDVLNIMYSGTATGSPWGARSVNGYMEGYLVYADETKTTLLTCSAAATGEVTLPNSVTSIGDDAFRGCSSLTSITIPNSVTSIGYRAFYGCSSLTSITLPNSVTSIGNYAFNGCSALTSVSLGNSVTSIGTYAFRYCTSLTSVIWNAKNCEGWSEKYAPFNDICANITSFTFGEEVETIPSCLCYCMSSLTSITLPNSVTSIENYAFAYCSSLTSITIPNSVTSIGNYVFQRCYSLTSITIGNSVTSIGNYAFNDCSALTSVSLGNSVTSIGTYAFRYCTSLTSITIGNSVTSIGEWAFAGCSSLTSITCLATTPPACGWESFYYVPRTIPLYVPAESVEEYKAADTWNEFDVQALSTDATLSSLTYDGMSVPSFDADTLHYTVDLPSETVDVPVVDAVANDLGAQITIHQATTLPGEASVEVLAADNTTRQTYTIYFSKKSTPTDISDRPDATGTDSDKGAEKLLRNGQVLIIRNGNTYNMMGQRL